MIGKSLKIMLVEDNEDHAELVIRSFNNSSIKNDIIRMKDGEEALSYLMEDKNSELAKKRFMPNLILLDLRLPKIDGLNVLKEIKRHKKLKKIPVIVLTSSESHLDMENSYSNHANSYLVKPTVYSEYEAMIGQISEYWFSLNRNFPH